MTTETLAPVETAVQMDPFAEIAASLRLAADRIETLVGSGLPKPNYFQLDIQPGGRGNDDDLIAASVDAVTTALLGHAGQIHAMSRGGYHYDNGTSAEALGAVKARIYQSVSAEWAEPRIQAAELEQSKAELAELRRRIAELEASTDRPDPLGLSYTRADTESDDPTPVSPARGLHVGAVTDGGLVDETAVAAAPDACTCWATSPNGCPQHAVSEAR